MIEAVLDAHGVLEVPLFALLEPEDLERIVAYVAAVADVVGRRTRLRAIRVHVRTDRVATQRHRRIVLLIANANCGAHLSVLIIGAAVAVVVVVVVVVVVAMFSLSSSMATARIGFLLLGRVAVCGQCGEGVVSGAGGWRVGAELLVEQPVGQSVVPGARVRLVHLLFLLLVLSKVPVEMLGVAAAVATIAEAARRRAAAAAATAALVLVEAVAARGALHAAVEALDGARVALLEQFVVEARQVGHFFFGWRRRLLLLLLLLLMLLLWSRGN